MNALMCKHQDAHWQPQASEAFESYQQSPVRLPLGGKTRNAKALDELGVNC